MKNIGRILWVLCAVGLVGASAYAQKVGSTSMQFMHVMPSARATGMGDAYSVLASGADAVFWNPSGLALVEKQEITSTYIKWIFDTQQGALAYAFPIENIGAFGVQIQYVDFGEFEETSDLPPFINNPAMWGATGRTFHPFSYMVGVSYARSLTDKFSTGITIKYARESLFNGSEVDAVVSSDSTVEKVKTWGSGVFFDFGVRYNTGFKSIQIAAAVQNFGGQVTYAKEASSVPLLFRVGIAADLIGKDPIFLRQELNRLTVAYDLFQPNDYAQQMHVGLEYEYSGVFALRAGYKVNYDSEGLTFGAGVKAPLGPVKLSVDYSYGSMGTYLGNIQRISLGAGLQ